MTMTPTRRTFLGQMAAASAALAAPGSLFAQVRMPTRAIPTTGEMLPIVGLGSSAVVLEIPENGPEPVAAVIRTLIAQGGKVVDTSVRTEAIDAVFGRVLQEPDIRQGIFLATKLNTTDADTGIAQMRQTQRLFARPTVDLIQIESLRGIEHHWPRLQEWKASGETRYIGVTVAENFNHEALEAFMGRERPDFVHMNYSLLERNAEERLLPLARDRGFAVLINRPFMNGSYFGRTAGRPLPDWAAEFDCESWAQFSLKYILANPAVTCVLAETTDTEHMIDNAGAGFGRLPSEDLRRRMREVAATL
jgi:diketogulonate reductase-like aldo/keto reductase